MSVRSRRRILLPEAREDLRDALLFTEQRWGQAQRRQYRQRLFDAFAELSRFPNLGRLRPELSPATLSFRVGQHVIVYRFTDTEFVVARILHVRRDVEGQFGAPTQ